MSLFQYIIKTSLISTLFLKLLLTSAFSQNDSVIVVFGDTRTVVSGNAYPNNFVNKSIIKTLMQFKPLAVFHTGDIVFNGLKKSAWEKFREFSKSILDNSRLYPAYGNHELHSKILSHDFALPHNGKWYSVDLMNIHFLIIDNFSDYKIGSEQYKWIEHDLKNCNKNAFRVVIMHLPVYSSGPHATQIKKLHKYLVPLFEKYGVNIVFSAHNHCYERAYSNGIYYITTAGGGAPMYPKTRNIPESQFFVNKYNFCTLKKIADNLHIEALDTSLNVIDTFEIKPH